MVYPDRPRRKASSSSRQRERGRQREADRPREREADRETERERQRAYMATVHPIVYPDRPRRKAGSSSRQLSSRNVFLPTINHF